MKKELFDLTEFDLEKYHAWYFPMNEDYSETTIIPVDSLYTENNQIIVATKFRTKNNEVFNGYIYAGSTNKINVVKPVIICGDENLNFWTGIRKPNIEGLKKNSLIYDQLVFPITYESFSFRDFESLSGVLEGIYFLDNDAISWY